MLVERSTVNSARGFSVPPSAYMKGLKNVKAAKTGVRKKMPNSQPSQPGAVLKALRRRADVSSVDCGVACGFSGPNGYLRYENDARYKTAKIPSHVISAVLPLFVGRGSPPVTQDELFEISDSADLLRAQVAPSTGTTSTKQASDDLVLKVTIDEDVFVRAEKLDSRLPDKKTGVLRDERFGADQFAAQVSDDSGGDYAPRGSILHCIDWKLTRALDEQLPYVVVRVERERGLVQFAIATASGGSFKSLKGQPIHRATPVGAILRRVIPK